MTDLITEHLAWLKAARYSAKAIAGRGRVLRGLPNLQPDREQMNQWWADYQTKADGEPRSPAALSQACSHVRSYFRWAMQQGHTTYNAADWLPRVRQKRPAVTPVSEGDLHRLIENAPDAIRRMVALAAMAGLRSEEVGAATWEDIDRGNGVLWVRLGKGSKGRSVPLSAGLLATLGDPSSGPIAGKAMTGAAVSVAISRYMRANGVNLTAHKLRARYATRFLAATGDLAAAAEALGHADLSSISRYVVASSDTMRRGAEAAGRIG